MKYSADEIMKQFVVLKKLYNFLKSVHDSINIDMTFIVFPVSLQILISIFMSRIDTKIRHLIFYNIQMRETECPEHLITFKFK